MRQTKIIENKFKNISISRNGSVKRTDLTAIIKAIKNSKKLAHEK